MQACHLRVCLVDALAYGAHARLVDPIRPYMMETEHMSLLP
jgi:hypothetical protein